MAVVITVSELQNKFPQITGKSTEDIERAIELQARVFTATREGALYLAAHFLTADQDTRIVDNVSVGSVGGLKVQYTKLAKEEQRFFETTHYGRVFLILQKSAPTSLGFTSSRALNV